jgi:hypothetical protein
MNSVNKFFSLLYVLIFNKKKILLKILFYRWPSNDFLITYLPTRHQWTILDQYCGKLNWFKELNSARFSWFFFVLLI